MARIALTAVLVACLTGMATPSSAQTNSVQWRHGTALAIFAGGASQSGTTDNAAGASIGWELTPNLTIEGSGLWVDTKGVDTFDALIGSRISMGPRRGIVPFVSAGVGVQNASVDMSATGVPDFYLRRAAAPAPPATGLRQTFDDFAIAVGGGVDWFLNHHVAVRPDVRVYTAFADRRARPMAVYGVHLAYHFEEHAVTPSIAVRP